MSIFKGSCSQETGRQPAAREHCHCPFKGEELRLGDLRTQPWLGGAGSVCSHAALPCAPRPRGSLCSTRESNSVRLQQGSRDGAHPGSRLQPPHSRCAWLCPDGPLQGKRPAAWPRPCHGATPVPQARVVGQPPVGKGIQGGHPPSPRAPRPSHTNVWVAVRRETSGLPRAAQVSKRLCDLIIDGNTRTLEACPGGHTRCSWKQHDCTTHGQGGCGQGQSGHCWPQAQQIEGNCGQWEGAGDSPPRGQEPLPAGDKRATTTGSGQLSEVPPAIPQPP